MKILVVGASGATGSLLVNELLKKGNHVKIIVRTPEKLPKSVRNHKNLEITKASLLDLSDTDFAKQVEGCEAVASCLGHNINLKGIYGQPRKLVTEATRRLCRAIKSTKSEKPVKFVLMSTSGYQNRDLYEPISFAQKIVIRLLRLLLPPHVDNEKAAEYLRTRIGQNHDQIEWVAVRPDGLINGENTSDYEAFPSPIRSAIFNAGKISRINVAHFMTELATHEAVWTKWKGQMPVLYDKKYVI
ncbi:NAD(P)-dependent oxidoreductase [Sunxiuqinia sp. A32]|uniref:NAD(P)-dependent oxidoreductase n=1 Tax=Sunxiuqinia sp. A32 TaxID=3461496 RepID=UPI004046391F